MAEFIFTFIPIFAIAMICLKVTVFSIILEDTDAKRDHQFYLLIGMTFLVSLVITSFFHFQFLANDDEIGVEKLGAIGDFFGGMLNPILAFASFIALLYTITIQSNGLRDSQAATNIAQKQLMQDMIFQGALTLFSRAEDRLTECDRELDYLYPFISSKDSVSLRALLRSYGDIQDSLSFNRIVYMTKIERSHNRDGGVRTNSEDDILFAVRQLNEKFRLAYQYVESCGKLLARAGQENLKDSLLMPTLVRLADIAFYLTLAGKHNDVSELTKDRPTNFFIEQYLYELQRKINQFSSG